MKTNDVAMFVRMATPSYKEVFAKNADTHVNDVKFGGKDGR